ncbi:MAG: hypothetical protein H6817_06425 [Phycisphaerales bacterium]|nr:hypothetical protein [Phycisphaerales bacterium]
MDTNSQLAVYFATENWGAAQRILRAEIRKDPEEHWYWTRLSTTHYEQRHYRMALRYALKAFELDPWCPLVRWDLAGALDSVRREREAIQVWRALLRLGPTRIAQGPCGEGIRSARRLLADCRYRIALAYVDLKEPRRALKYFDAYIRDRTNGAGSIYNLATVRKERKAAAEQVKPTRAS